MPGGHHPRGTVQHRTEVVGLPQFGLAGRDPHPHRQLQLQLRGHRRIDRTPRRGERGAHPIPGVLEQPAPVRLDRLTQHLVMGGQRRPHPLGVGLPPTGRNLHIGEQKRHHPRWRHRSSLGIVHGGLLILRQGHGRPVTAAQGTVFRRDDPWFCPSPTSRLLRLTSAAYVRAAESISPGAATARRAGSGRPVRERHLIFVA